MVSVSKTIGTNAKSDIVLTGKYISDKHAILTVDDDRVIIEDLNSTFGTHVNGKQINKPTELITKNRVKLGTQIFHWTDYIGEQQIEKNPIYWKDLFLPFGHINWSDYKYILLIAIGLTIIIPIGVPAALAFAESELNRRPNFEIELMQYVEPSI